MSACDKEADDMTDQRKAGSAGAFPDATFYHVSAHLRRNGQNLTRHNDMWTSADVPAGIAAAVR